MTEVRGSGGWAVAPLLDAVRVVDLTGEPALLAGRLLADLGAEVHRIEPAEGHPVRRVGPFAPDGSSLRFLAWSAGITSVAVDSGDDPRLAELLRDADIVLTTPGWPGTIDAPAGAAPGAVWVNVTPFGSEGPRAGWHASDLGIMAATGNLFATGDPDRAPVRCAEPVAYAHAGPEIAFAALTALASGRPQTVDVSMQEIVLVASMGSVGRYAREHHAGRRRGASVGRTREIWPCRDGFVSFGLRGGAARVASLETLTGLVADDGVEATALVDRDWTTFDQNAATDAELAAIEAPVAAYFARHTMQELYRIACATNLMLAPANSPREILASEQLDARGFFGAFAGIEHFPQRSVIVRPGPPPKGSPAPHAVQPSGPAWTGTRLLEFGSGAAGPIATRYFAEHGATVVRVESRRRPDFLRAYGTGSSGDDRLERSGIFDALNPGKLSITLDLKHPEGRAVAVRLARWADAVSENFAPKAMRGLGLDYDTLVGGQPELVMASACLNGQTGPHRDYPGFGGQGSALGGYNILTGWPDREPIGPHGTITDSLAPRFVATALAAALHHRDRTGRGCHLDISQVECALYTLSPWLLDYEVNGVITERLGNRSARAVPHGIFPSEGPDRWVAVAVWTDDEWARLAGLIGLDDPALGEFVTRAERIDEIETALASWTAGRTALDAAEQLQALGLEAVPVQDFADTHDDPQLVARHHLLALDHPVLGPGDYERNGFRLSDAPSGYAGPSPLLGQHNEFVLGELLGLDRAAQSQLRDAGVLG